METISSQTDAEATSKYRELVLGIAENVERSSDVTLHIRREGGRSDAQFAADIDLAIARRNRSKQFAAVDYTKKVQEAQAALSEATEQRRLALAALEDSRQAADNASSKADELFEKREDLLDERNRATAEFTNYMTATAYVGDGSADPCDWRNFRLSE
ncbi:hypothetical protein [Lacipirellula parvula]|uniref:Uncharacterized protein n=1 Tax=Lacipirellula parvula TaxID=2650471 RepID=A0A5K7XAY0_9BACT|nr:hypothetical protein [Lacipirellula parvula]BBO31951.1 hypothetical protein PLANPX_1563 [Lacipirellula parvula]